MLKFIRQLAQRLSTSCPQQNDRDLRPAGLLAQTLDYDLAHYIDDMSHVLTETRR